MRHNVHSIWASISASEEKSVFVICGVLWVFSLLPPADTTLPQCYFKVDPPSMTSAQLWFNMSCLLGKKICMHGHTTSLVCTMSTNFGNIRSFSGISYIAWYRAATLINLYKLPRSMLLVFLNKCQMKSRRSLYWPTLDFFTCVLWKHIRKERIYMKLRCVLVNFGDDPDAGSGFCSRFWSKSHGLVVKYMYVWGTWMEDYFMTS